MNFKSENFDTDVKKFLKKKNIEELEKIKFSNSDEILLFFEKIKIILKKGINLNFINNDIKKIILEADLNNEEILTKFKTILWQNLYEIDLKKNTNKRTQHIYNRFIIFVREELDLPIKNEPNNLKENNFKEQKLKDKDDCKNENPEQSLDFLKKRTDFNEDLDTKMKSNLYNIDIVSDYKKISSNTSVNDFTLFFIQRLDYYTRIIKKISNNENLIKISSLEKLWTSNEKVMIIGLLSEFSYTKKGHLILTIEDKSGTTKCFINKNKFEPNSERFNKQIAHFIENMCLDEGLGIIGNVGDKIIWVEDIIMPSFPYNNEFKKTEEEHYIVCLSDLHYGSKLFVEEAFQKFLDWINGRTNNSALNQVAKKVKHIIIGGDMIEGIGIFPGQEKELNISSTEAQYKKLALILSQIPKDKSIILIPGNHDTTRLLEPQIKMPYEKAYALYNLPNCIILSNPSSINLFTDDPSGGINLYLYHGSSIFYYGDKIKSLRMQGGALNPNEVIKYFLDKRHLSPSHGAVPYIPDNEVDPLVITKNPDLFICGHTHRIQITNYKGCTIISAGCWSEVSEYQESRGMKPDIGKAIIINTKTRNINMFNFYDKKDDK